MIPHSHALRRSAAVKPPVGSGDTGAPVTSSLAGASFSSPYRELLRQRAYWQATYDRHCSLRQSQAAEAARKRLWAATCALLDYERHARTVDL